MGETIFKLETSAGVKTAKLVVDDFPWDVKREGDDITFTLGAGDAEQTKPFTVTAVRKFVLENFNWNGIVHLMHLLSDKNDNFTYTRPTGLTGEMASDNVLIIPDEATEAIVYEQAKYAIETTYADKPEDKIEEIKDYVDGKAKTDFSKDILETTYEDLIKESDNSDMAYDGVSFSMPELKTVSESDLYDFLKNLSLSRNGLWLDDDKLTNFVSIRRVLDKTSPDYNDTSFLAWKEGGTKKALQYISSTEPGNLKVGQLLPQTLSMILGLHNTSNATPAGRTRSAYRVAEVGNNKYFQSGDTTMNVHYGDHRMQGLPKDNSEYGIGSNRYGGKIYSGNDLNAFLTIVKVYEILTQWGDGTRATDIPCYVNLENHTKKYTLSELLGATDATKKLEVYKDGDKVAKTLTLKSYTTYIGKTYAASGKKTIDATKKDNAIKLLMNYHERAGDGKAKSDYDEKELKDLIKDLKQDFIFKSVVATQLEEELNLKNVDAQPGGGTLRKINRTKAQKVKDTKEFKDLKKEAEEHYKEINKLFALWDTYTVLPKKLRKKCKEDIKSLVRDYTNTDLKDVDDKGGTGILKDVSTWSFGCQVIYGGQHFYQFMHKLTQFLPQSKQEIWYYTLVDMDTLTGVTKGAPAAATPATKN